MSEFGLELPLPTTKLGTDGKGPKAFVVKQSLMATILGVSAVLLLLTGCLFFDIRSQRTTFTHDLRVQSQMSEHQHTAKIEAEANLQQAAAQLSEEVAREKDEESDLAIMGSHITYVQHTVKSNIFKLFDDETLNVADIKKAVTEQFRTMQEEVESIMHDHLVTVKDANKKSQAAMEFLHNKLVVEMKEQQEEEKRYQDAKESAHHTSAAPTPADPASEAVYKRAETHINSIFNHVYDLAEKMTSVDGEDVNRLLKPETIKEWEQLLTDTETGKLNYDEAVKKMEEVLTKYTAALHLGHATGAFERMHKDGGKKGVTEITNFRNLLKHIKWIPQYGTVFQQLREWKSGNASTQDVLTWIQEQIKAGKLDDSWLNKAIETPTAATTVKTNTATATATASSTSTANIAPATATATAAATAAANAATPTTGGL